MLPTNQIATKQKASSHRLGRFLLALIDARLSYWRECKYAIRIFLEAIAGQWEVGQNGWKTHLHVVKYSQYLIILCGFSHTHLATRRLLVLHFIWIILCCLFSQFTQNSFYFCLNYIRNYPLS